jgi:hypothetical protein
MEIHRQMNLIPAPFTGQQISSPQRELWENPENEIDSSPVYGAKEMAGSRLHNPFLGVRRGVSPWTLDNAFGEWITQFAR